MKIDTHNLFSSMPLFKGLSAEERKALLPLFRPQKAKRGEVIYRKGSEGHSLYIIEEGAVKILLSSNSGEERIVTIFSKGDFFGEMALLDNMPRSTDAVALEPTRLLLLNRSDFLSFLKKNHSAMETLLAFLIMKIRNTYGILADTSFLNIPVRFNKKLLELGETFGRRNGASVKIGLRLTQKELADMTGATREYISKELRELREKGLVSRDITAITIHDEDSLRLRIQ